MRAGASRHLLTEKCEQISFNTRESGGSFEHLRRRLTLFLSVQYRKADRETHSENMFKQSDRLIKETTGRLQKTQMNFNLRTSLVFFSF